eukprot:SAG25_NODE_292_length_10289_cov_21.085770_5_plen_55_part_00
MIVNHMIVNHMIVNHTIANHMIVNHMIVDHTMSITHQLHREGAEHRVALQPVLH